MKILQVYNQYRSLFNGEEKVVFQTVDLINKYGGDAQLMMRTSRGIENSLWRKAHAFFNGVYSREAFHKMQEMLTDDRPDVVHVHNLYPLFSPSVLVACRKARVPVVMSLHNQNLTCPKADHLRNGSICESCTGFGGELHCVLKNCRGNLVESVGYAFRSAVARKLGLFHDNVTLFIALTEFAKQRLVNNGFRADQIEVLPNMVDTKHDPVDPGQGAYAAFAGRLSPEKGVDTLLLAASHVPKARLQIAGGGPLESELNREAPANVKMLGQLKGQCMADFYRRASMLVLPSKCFEMCPLTILEAMSHGLPVIASRIGGLGELVADGVTGLLFEPGNERDLAAKIQQLWSDPELRRRMGRAGYEKAQRCYSEHAYHEKLTAIYRKAQRLIAPETHSADQESNLETVAS